MLLNNFDMYSNHNFHQVDENHLHIQHFLQLSLPVLVINVPFLAILVGKTQSNISIPRIAPSINESGEPTPIK